MATPTPPPANPPAHAARPAKSRAEPNTIRPTPALASWVNRTVSRWTKEPPWTYEGESASAPPAAVPPPATAASKIAERERAARIARAVPAEVRERFLRVGRDYHLPNGSVALRDQGTHIVVLSENTEVIRSSVLFAPEREWNDITVTGSKRFKQAAWREATRLGLIVRGYTPTALEKAQFVRDLAAARAGPVPHEPVVDPPIPSAPRGSPDPPPFRGPEPGAQRTFQLTSPAPQPDRAAAAPPAAAPARSAAREPASVGPNTAPPAPRHYQGTLLAHGPAPYQFHENGAPSYYVRLQSGDRQQELWGVDFERALRESSAKPKVGDEVGVREVGRTRVPVTQKDYDAQGQLVAEREIQVDRNQWQVEAPAFFETAPAPNGREKKASRRGSTPAASRSVAAPSPVERSTRDGYLALAKKFAAAQIRDAQDREAFVKAFARQLAKVETLPPLQLRDRTARGPRDRGSRTPERDRELNRDPVLG
jgi:hypothetical protein